MEVEETDLLTAAVDLIGHTGATGFEMRFQDDHDPVVWVAVATYERDGKKFYEAGGALDPTRATLRLLDLLVDGGFCVHCKRPTGVSTDFTEMPMNESICWYQLDPELKKFRRSCEGDTLPTP